MKKKQVFKSSKSFLLLAGIAVLSLCFIPRAFTEALSSAQRLAAPKSKPWNERPAAAAEETSRAPRTGSLEFLQGETWSDGNLAVESGSFAPNS